VIKALLWKEWREQRGIAFAGAAVALMIPLMTITIASLAGAPDFRDVSEVVPFLFAMVVWPLFAALAGATVNSESASMASAGFLLSRPVPRPALWLIKVAIASVAIAFVVSLSFYAALRVDVLVGGWGFNFPFSSDPFAWPPDGAVQSMAVGGLGVTFCGAILLSTLLRRSIAAAMGGLALAIASQLGAVFAASRIGASRLGSGVEDFLYMFSAGLCVVLLGASLYLFRRAGLTGMGDARRAARPAATGIVVSLLPLIMLAGFTSTRITADRGVLRFARSVPGTDLSVVFVHGTAFAGSSLWVAEPGRPLRPLTGRLAEPVAVSPDGEWLVYWSRLSAIGTRQAACELRAARIDGSEDRVLAAGANRGRWCADEGGFGPDGQRLALRVDTSDTGERLLIASIDGGAPRYIDVSEIAPGRSVRIIPKWTSPDAVLLYSYYGDASYWRVNVDSGTIEAVYVPSEDVYFSTLASSPTHLLVREYERGDYSTNPLESESRHSTTKLITVADSSTRDIRPLCSPDRDTWGTRATLSADGRYAYFTCRSDSPRAGEGDFIDSEELFRGSLMRRDLQSGADTIIAGFDGYVASIMPSPDATRFLVLLADPQPVVQRVAPSSRRVWRGLSYRYVLVERDGTLRPLDITPTWSAGQWFDNDRLVLSGRGLAYLELHEQAIELRTIYTPPEDVR
jgi:ABC-type transport system involved in multi-copper enzyme maturation permease subunit